MRLPPPPTTALDTFHEVGGRGWACRREAKKWREHHRDRTEGGKNSRNERENRDRGRKNTREGGGWIMGNGRANGRTRAGPGPPPLTHSSGIPEPSSSHSLSCSRLFFSLSHLPAVPTQRGSFEYYLTFQTTLPTPQELSCTFLSSRTTTWPWRGKQAGLLWNQNYNLCEKLDVSFGLRDKRFTKMQVRQRMTSTRETLNPRTVKLRQMHVEDLR